MSTHRKIEWLLFILGLIGLGTSLLLGGGQIELSLFGTGTVFAGLHVFHLFDGRSANRVVMVTSIILATYTGYMAVTNILNGHTQYSVITSFGVSLLLSLFALRLRSDFHKV